MEIKWTQVAIFLFEVIRTTTPSIAGVSYRDDFDFEERYANENECNPLYWHPLHLPSKCAIKYEQKIRANLKLKNNIQLSYAYPQVVRDDSPSIEFVDSPIGPSTYEIEISPDYELGNFPYGMGRSPAYEIGISSIAGLGKSPTGNTALKTGKSLTYEVKPAVYQIGQSPTYDIGISQTATLNYDIGSNDDDYNSWGWPYNAKQKHSAKGSTSWTTYDVDLTYSEKEKRIPMPYDRVLKHLKKDIEQAPSQPRLGVLPFLGPVAIYDQEVSKKSENMIKELASAYARVGQKGYGEYLGLDNSDPKLYYWDSKKNKTEPPKEHDKKENITRIKTKKGGLVTIIETVVPRKRVPRAVMYFSGF